jgi:hypothetical protein
MRPLELAMTIVIAAALVAELPPARLRPAWWPRLQLALPVAAALLFQFHALLDGPRPELLPLYALGLASLAWAGARLWTGKGIDGNAGKGPSRPLDLLLALAGLALLAWIWATTSPG